MKYEFRPYAKMQPTIVTLTGKVYEKGEHPLYTEYKIIEVVDEEGEIHYAFENELTSDEVKEQERSYSEEIVDILDNVRYWETCPDKYKIIIEEWLKQFKKK